MNRRAAGSLGTQGFTLLEVLLGLSLFALIGLTVYSVFAGGVKLSRQSEGEIETYREGYAALELMGKDLENARPYDFSGSYPDNQAFTGETDEIIFLQAAGQGLRAVRYFLLSPNTSRVHKVLIGSVYAKNTDIVLENRKEEASYLLVREEVSFPNFLGNGFLGEDVIREVLATRVKEGSLRFHYAFMEGEQNPVLSWRNKWGQAGIPADIRIEVEFVLPEGGQTVAMQKDVLIPHGVFGKTES